ncbi:hypothetical protein [Bradyrhizobium sp. UFLA05-112]
MIEEGPGLPLSFKARIALRLADEAHRQRLGGEKEALMNRSEGAAMTDEALRSVAYHEAGHAVVALALGLKIARVQIFQEDYSGAADAENADHLPLVDRIAICVAGMNAAEMFDAPPSHELADSGDHRMVLELLEELEETDETTAYDLRQNGHRRAWDLLEAHASSVEDIAAELLAQRKIDLTEYVLKP